MWAKLGAVADIQLGKMLSKKAFSDDLQMLPYLRNANIRWGTVDLTDLKKMGFSGDEAKKFELKKGDILSLRRGCSRKMRCFE